MTSSLRNPIFVTQPALPPLEEFTELLKQIWDNKILTNNGPFHKKFEQELADYLGVKYISLFSNGKLPELLTWLEKTFDYIIIDTAPVNPITDAYIISPLA